MKRNIFCLLILLVVVFSFSGNSFSQAPLKFQVMVIDRNFLLDSVYINGVKEIILQHAVRSDTSTSFPIYYLVAYAKNLGGSYTRIRQSGLFVGKEEQLQSIEFKSGGAEAPVVFGNMTLDKSKVPTKDSSFKYIYLYPSKIGNDDATNPDDLTYVHYEIFFRTTKGYRFIAESELDFDVLGLKKGVDCVSCKAKEINPSPPRH